MQRLGLVRPQPLDAAARASAAATSGCSSSGSATARAGAAVLRGLHDEPLVLAAGGEQRVPGLDVADDGHPRCETRRVLRCVYVDLDRTMRGAGDSFLHDADGAFTLLGARALEACDRAGAEVVLHSSEPAAEVEPVARLLGLRAWIADGGELLVLDGERGGAGRAAPRRSAATSGRAPARREEAIAVGAELGLEAVVGTLWLAGDALEDPLLRLELEDRERVRTAEERGPAALYEAVVTTLAGQATAERGRSSSA